MESDKSRIRSLYIIHGSILIFSIGNSIIFTGVWPYLKLLEPNVSLEFYGFVVAADALAQFIFSPIFGYLADRLDSVRLISMFCAIIFSVGNLMYATIAVVPRKVGSLEYARVWYMLFARFVVGTGTAINASCRTYLSKATYQSERTTHIALFSLFQTLGFILGPAIQASLTPIGEELEIDEGSTFIFDMYTATGYVSIVTGLCAFMFYLPGVFVEHSVMGLEEDDEEEEIPDIPIAKKNPRELLKQLSRISVIDGNTLMTLDKPKRGKSKGNVEETKKYSPFSAEVPKPDWLATLASTYNFFSFLFNFVLIETIVTPLAMDQWGWSQEDTILYLGITMACGGILAGFCFATIGPFSRRFDERLLFIFAGLVPMIVGRIIMLPFGSELPPLLSTNKSPNTSRSDSVTSLTGCGYDWCTQIGAITVPQFMVGYVFALIGYPFCVALCGSIFSKVLGPIPQGFWMGLLTTSGSLARVIGPIFISFIYQEFGTWATFGIITGSLLVSLILTLISYKRLVPYEKLQAK